MRNRQLPLLPQLLHVWEQHLLLPMGRFAAPGDPIVSWSWIMPGGNPNFAATQNTSTLYNTAGTHTVTLIVTSQAGLKDTIDQQVVVYSSPVADFTYGILLDSTYNFFDLSISTDGALNSWSWNFPGGIPSTSNAENPGGYSIFWTWVVSHLFNSDHNIRLCRFNLSNNDNIRS